MRIEPPHHLGRRDFLKRSAQAGVGLSIAAFLGPQAHAARPPQLRAGVSKGKITPPVSIPYLTSSGNGTCKEFEGLHDDLFARALVLQDGKRSIAVLAVDSIGYDNLILGSGHDFTKELRKRIAAKTDLRPEEIMLTATHAHSTPETIGLTVFRDIPRVSEWIENHLSELADTAIAAWKKPIPVRARFGKRRVEGIARNRRILLKNKTLSRYGAIPPPDQIAAPWFVDEDLSVLYFDSEDGVPQAVLLNYTAHPVVTMLLPKISADYPGCTSAYVETALPNAICLFTQGAAGNINSVQVSSNYEDATRLGEKFGAAAVAEIEKLKMSTALPEFSLRAQSTIIHLQPRDCLRLRDAQKIASRDPSPQNLRILRLAQKLAVGPLRAEIQAMRIGPVNWISFPGEPFVETGLVLKRAGASFVCGYTNGWLGYFPIRHGYDEGGYEVDLGAWSRVAPGSAEVLATHAVRLLQSFI